MSLNQFQLFLSTEINANISQRTQSHQQSEILVPQRANSLLEENSPFKQQINKQADLQNKTYYKSAMQIVENHLKEPKNPLKLFIEGYFRYFEEFNPQQNDKRESKIFEPLLASISSFDPYNKNVKKVKQQKLQSVFDDIKGFTEFFILSLYSFYNLDIILEDQNQLLQQFNQQNLSSFGLTLLFRNDQLFEFIFTKLKELYHEETDAFYSNLETFRDERPSYFDVPKHLELILDSCQEQIEGSNLEHIDNRVPSSYMLPNHQFFLSDLSRQPSKNPNLRQTEGEEQKQNQTGAQLQQQVPYYLAIKQLQQLKKVRSPVHQLKLISKTTDLIQFSINEFYQNNNLKLIKNFGADELVPILCYVVVKSEIRDLGTYLKIVENFTPRQSLNSSAGYKLVTLQSCFSIISNMQPKKSEILSKIKSSVTAQDDTIFYSQEDSDQSPTNQQQSKHSLNQS